VSPPVRASRLHVRRRSQDHDVVSGVDLEVRAGEWVGLIGPNGAGKTTLLHVLAGLLPRREVAVTGLVTVAGVDPLRASRRVMARRVAVVPQRPVVPPGFTVRQYVLLGRHPHVGPWTGESRRDVAAVADALERLDLAAFARRPATDLSGGELQRVVLARAVVQQPAVLLLDEPTSALDIGHQQTVLDLVDRLRHEGSLTVVAAMHDLTLAGQYADRLVLLDAGQVVADGPASHVLTPELLAKVYEARVRLIETPDGPAVVPMRDEWH
jgi:iron complex transport system ATP-binding protein